MNTVALFRSDERRARMPCTCGITALHWPHDTKHEDACNGIGNGLRFKQLLRSDPDLTLIWNVLSRGELVLLEQTE